MKTTDLRNPSSVKHKMLGAYLTPYRKGSGYMHASVSRVSDEALEKLYWRNGSKNGR